MSMTLANECVQLVLVGKLSHSSTAMAFANGHVQLVLEAKLSDLFIAMAIDFYVSSSLFAFISIILLSMLLLEKVRNYCF